MAWKTMLWIGLGAALAAAGTAGGLLLCRMRPSAGEARRRRAEREARQERELETLLPGTGGWIA